MLSREYRVLRLHLTPRFCCRTTKSPLTKSLAVERVMGTVAFTMLPGRYGGTEALVVRTNLHPVPINQERHSSLGGRSVAAARATLPGTGFGTWTLRIEAGDSVSTEIATAAATGFRSPLVLPLGFLLGEAFCHRHRASHGMSRRTCWCQPGSRYTASYSFAGVGA